MKNYKIMVIVLTADLRHWSAVRRYTYTCALHAMRTQKNDETHANYIDVCVTQYPEKMKNCIISIIPYCG